MQLEAYFDFLESGDIRIKGHRIGIEHVVRLYREGFSPEQVAQHYPGLSLEKIYATITYYLHYQDEIDRYMAEGDAWREEQYQHSLQDPTSPMHRIRQMRASHYDDPLSAR
ncbi:MAG: DUF433 domain-containing protein [Chloroflexaceae bacterium]|nr:DUF433 domain-containing protein [Chloroflexaceae bacterium]